MLTQKIIRRAVLLASRRHASQRPNVVLDEDVAKDIEQEVFKPRNHPGVVKPKTVLLPDAFVKAANIITQDYPQKTLRENGQTLTRYLKGRHLPLEAQQLKAKQNAAYQMVMDRDKNKNNTLTTEKQKKSYEQSIEDQVQSVIKYHAYNWEPVLYDVNTALVYLMGRAAPEYAALVRIFAEIACRDPGFKPRSLFDFGSGLGTVTWAATQYWKDSIYEYFNVDSSSDMNDLAQLLLRGGQPTKEMQIKGAFYRQFLPSENIGFDMVVSAYSLLELPSRQARLQTLLTLWNKVTNYLVIVESGTKSGFTVINEARDFILNISKKNVEANLGGEAHIFAPCPHDLLCPKVLLDEEACKFKVRYWSMAIGGKACQGIDSYSYVVFKKSERDPTKLHWPRAVEETLVRHKHAICRVCTSAGRLEELIVTKSRHGKMAHHCARNTERGDLLPVKLEEIKTED